MSEIKGTEAQVKFATELLNEFESSLLNWSGDECQTTKEWRENVAVFLATLTNDASKIIECLKSQFNNRFDIQDIRELGADVWSEIEKSEKRNPVGYRRTMEMRK